MKHALLIGCGNHRGSKIINGCLRAGYTVTNIGSSVASSPDVDSISIDWAELDVTKLHKILKNIDNKIDFIFFNQNASSLSLSDLNNTKKTVDMWTLIKRWSNSYWLSCQMPYFVIQTLGKKISPDARIGWMLSGYIDRNRPGVGNHPDYSGYKFTNYLIMKGMSKKYQCFGINPEFESKDKVETIIKDVCDGTKKCDGEMF
jgi:hypothetical protein